MYIQGGSNMTGTDLCVNLATSVPVIFEPPCTTIGTTLYRLQNKCTNCKGVKNNTNFGQITGIQENM